MSKLRLFFRHLALLALLATLLSPYLAGSDSLSIGGSGEVSPQVNWNSGSL